MQSDWVREVKHYAGFPCTCPQCGPFDAKRKAAYQRYLKIAWRPYAEGWEEVALAAALFFIVEELGLTCVYMHEFETGNRIKNINPRWTPPRSLYTRLPRRFGFALGEKTPSFLARHLAKPTKTAKRDRNWRPKFWHMVIEPPIH